MGRNKETTPHKTPPEDDDDDIPISSFLRNKSKSSTTNNPKSPPASLSSGLHYESQSPSHEVISEEERNRSASQPVVTPKKQGKPPKVTLFDSPSGSHQQTTPRKRGRPRKVTLLDSPSNSSDVKLEKEGVNNTDTTELVKKPRRQLIVKEEADPLVNCPSAKKPETTTKKWARATKGHSSPLCVSPEYTTEAVVDEVDNASSPTIKKRGRKLILNSELDSPEDSSISTAEKLKGKAVIQGHLHIHEQESEENKGGSKRKRGRPPKGQSSPLCMSPTDTPETIIDEVRSTSCPPTTKKLQRKLIIKSELESQSLIKGKAVLQQEQESQKIKDEPDTLSEDITFTTISSLQEFQRQWKIKVRVMRKSTIENYKNAKGEGSLQRLLLMDTEGVLIQAVLFNEAIQNIGENIIKGETCFISNGTVKAVNKDYIHVHERLELSLNAATHIERAKVPIQRNIQEYRFVEFDDLHNYLNTNKTIDILAYLVDVDPLKEVRRGNTIIPQRVVTLADLKSNQIRLTMWGDLAIEEGNDLLDHMRTKPVVAISMAKVTIAPTGIVALTSLSITTVEIDPQVQQTKHMNQWVCKGMDEVETTYMKPPNSSTFPVINLSDLLQRNIVGTKNTYFYFKATITAINKARDPWYNACNKCNKKVITTSTNSCSSCGAIDIKCTPRYALKMDVEDGQHTTTVTLFDAAEKLLGCSVQDFISKFQQEGSTSNELLQNLLGKEFNFLIKMDRGKDSSGTSNNFIAYDVTTDM